MYFAFNQDLNMVRDDYYEEELEFQAKIEKIKRTNDLTENLIVKQENNRIIFKFPSIFSSQSISGNIVLYRPSDSNLDVSFPISLDTSSLQYFPTESLLSGLWKIKIDWKSDATTYFNNEIIMVP